MFEFTPPADEEAVAAAAAAASKAKAAAAKAAAAKPPKGKETWSSIASPSPAAKGYQPIAYRVEMIEMCAPASVSHAPRPS